MCGWTYVVIFVCVFQLLVEHGLMKPLNKGVYYYLPLLQRSIDKASNLISRFMHKVDAQKITIPILTPAHLWRESGLLLILRLLPLCRTSESESNYLNCLLFTGRFSQYEDVLFLTKDKTAHELLLGPVRITSIDLSV